MRIVSVLHQQSQAIREQSEIYRRSGRPVNIEGCVIGLEKREPR